MGPSRLRLLARHGAVKGQAGPGLQGESIVCSQGGGGLAPRSHVCTHIRPGKQSCRLLPGQVGHEGSRHLGPAEGGRKPDFRS